MPARIDHCGEDQKPAVSLLVDRKRAGQRDMLRVASRAKAERIELVQEIELGGLGTGADARRGLSAGHACQQRCGERGGEYLNQAAMKRTLYDHFFDKSLAG